MNGNIGPIGTTGYTRPVDINKLDQAAPSRPDDAKYPESFVDKFQKRESLGSPEARQDQAYTAFKQSGVLGEHITRMDQNIMTFLKVRDTGEELSKDAIFGELDTIQGKGLLSGPEKDLIKKEIDTFIALYKAAFPQKPDKEVLELALDNSRKLAYQTAKDKEVFSGSDHGTKHLLEGNMDLANQMIGALESQGVTVSPLDKVLIHQVIIDHDIGYTVDPAQTSFDASKDHPLFSAAYIESHQGDYERKNKKQEKR
jgi:hypothetical protein